MSENPSITITVTIQTNPITFDRIIERLRWAAGVRKDSIGDQLDKLANQICREVDRSQNQPT